MAMQDKRREETIASDADIRAQAGGPYEIAQVAGAVEGEVVESPHCRECRVDPSDTDWYTQEKPCRCHCHVVRNAPRPFPARLVREAIMDAVDGDIYDAMWDGEYDTANRVRLDFADAVVARLRELIASREKEG